MLADLESEDPDEDASWMAYIDDSALEQELLKLIRQRRGKEWSDWDSVVALVGSIKKVKENAAYDFVLRGD